MPVLASHTKRRAETTGTSCEKGLLPSSYAGCAINIGLEQFSTQIFLPETLATTQENFNNIPHSTMTSTHTLTHIMHTTT